MTNETNSSRQEKQVDTPRKAANKLSTDTRSPVISKPRNVAKIVALIAIPIIIMIFVGLLAITVAFLSWRTSPQRAYYQISKAVEDKDEDAFYNYLNVDKIKQNAPMRGETAGEIDKENIKLFLGFLEDKGFATSPIDAYRNPAFVKEGDRYAINTAINFILPVDVKLYLEKVNGKWQIVEIKTDSPDLTSTTSENSPQSLGGSLPGNALNTSENSEPAKEYDIAYQQTQKIDAFEYTVKEVEIAKSLTYTYPQEVDFYGGETVKIDAPADKQLIKVVLSAKNTGTKPEYSGLIDMRLSADNKEYDATYDYYEYINAIESKYESEGFKSTTNVNPDETGIDVLIFEIPESVAKDSMYLTSSRDYAFDGQEKYQAKFYFK